MRFFDALFGRPQEDDPGKLALDGSLVLHKDMPIFPGITNHGRNCSCDLSDQVAAFKHQDADFARDDAYQHLMRNKKEPNNAVKKAYDDFQIAKRQYDKVFNRIRAKYVVAHNAASDLRDVVSDAKTALRHAQKEEESVSFPEGLKYKDDLVKQLRNYNESLVRPQCAIGFDVALPELQHLPIVKAKTVTDVKSASVPFEALYLMVPTWPHMVLSARDFI
eukprot:GEMP01065048.1.p1 GENE.GEMP01065048.1~~GEMP01065048.1.p1  ORF type:complete len:220 (+),score=51.65 GEMP01065048.1:97-756(+)